MLSPEIQSKVNFLWDKFLGGGISDQLDALEQVGCLMYIKWLDEEDNVKRKSAKNRGGRYQSIFKGKFIPTKSKFKTEVSFDELRWSSFKILPPSGRLAWLVDQVFPFIKNLDPVKYPLTEYLQPVVCLISRPALLDDAMRIIDEIYDEIDKQRQSGQPFINSAGHVFEYLMNEVPVGPKAGLFRTPRHIARLIVELIDPTTDDTICDPACGSGGFLVQAYRHILSKNSEEDKLFPPDENGFREGDGSKIVSQEIWDRLQRITFSGYDVSDRMVRTSYINLLLHGITRPFIESRDSLSNNESEGDYTVVLCNPPFGGTINVVNSEGLRVNTKNKDLLFLDRFMQMLATGGRAGIITPDNLLTESSNAHRELRKILLLTCDLKAVISLPAVVFRPYSKIKASILIFTKMPGVARKPNPEGDGYRTQKVWFYDMNIDGDGYTLDNHRRPQNNRVLPELINDFHENISTSRESTDRTSKHFMVPIREIIANDFHLGIDRYKAIPQELKYDPPTEILAKLMKLEEEIMQDMKSLNELIK